MTLHVFYGPTGSGKTTISREFEAKCGWRHVPTITTRPRRDTDTDDHIFVTEDELVDMAADQEFAYLKTYPVATGENWSYGMRFGDIYADDRPSYCTVGINEANIIRLALADTKLIEIQLAPSACWRNAVNRGDDPNEVTRRLLSDLDHLYSDNAPMPDYIIESDRIILEHPNPKLWMRPCVQ